MVKHLTLVTNQKKELEQDLHQANILNEYKHVPSYKTQYELKSKTKAFLRLKKTSLVPLFKLADEVTRVRMEVEETMDACEAAVIGKDHVNAYFLGWGQESVPAMLRLLQFAPKFMLNSEDQPDLSDLGLH